MARASRSTSRLIPTYLPKTFLSVTVDELVFFTKKLMMSQYLCLCFYLLQSYTSVCREEHRIYLFFFFGGVGEVDGIFCSVLIEQVIACHFFSGFCYGWSSVCEEFKGGGGIGGRIGERFLLYRE
jgi:hypothetical protein